MSEVRYKIVFDGELMPEMSLDTVKDNLSKLFKSERSKIDALFGGTAVALKRDLAEPEADKYLAALQQAGAKVRKEHELGLSLSLVDTAEHQPATATMATTAEPSLASHLMSCPKCGHQQAKAAECAACGIIIEKYLARQAQQIEAAPQTTGSATPSPYSTPKAEVGESLSKYAELKVFSVSGRIGRVRYLGWSAALMFIAMIAYGLVAAGMALSPVLGFILAAPLTIAFVVVSVQIGVQRLHDIGWSGWLWLLNFVPAIGSIFALLMLVVPGNSDANRYGPPPPPNSRGVVALAWTLLLIPIIGILAAISLPAYQDYTERAQQAQLQQQSRDSGE